MGWKIGYRLGFSAVLSCLLFFGPVSQAQAGWFDWMKGISEVPSDVDQLKSKYEEMEQSLLDTQQRYQEMTSQLNAENEALRLQNEQLTQRLLLLEEQELQQKQRTSRITTMILTGAGLLVLYFILTRIMRVFVWRRHSSN